jgi:hypothetical protein
MRLRDVRYWPKADIGDPRMNVRFRGADVTDAVIEEKTRKTLRITPRL